MLNELQEKWCSDSTWDFSDLKALFLNCTLKRSPELSHTDGLIRISQAIMEKNGVAVENLRPIDYDIATGVYPDMTEQGWEKDDWPQIYEKVEAAHIHFYGLLCSLGYELLIVRAPQAGPEDRTMPARVGISLTGLFSSHWPMRRAISPYR